MRSVSSPLPRELLDHPVVLGIVLPAAAGVADAGHAEAVQLAHEVPRRVQLILERELRRARDRRVEDEARSARRSAGPSARRSRRGRSGRRADSASYESKPRPAARRGSASRSRRGAARTTGVSGAARVQLVEGRHPPLGELQLVPAADDAHPLRRRRALGLLLQPARARRRATGRRPSAARGCSTGRARITWRCESLRPGMTRRSAGVDDLRARADRRFGLGAEAEMRPSFSAIAPPRVGQGRGS